MAGLPTYDRRTILESVGVMRMPNAAAGLAQGLSDIGAGFGLMARQQEDEAERQRIADGRLEGTNTAVTADENGNLSVKLVDNSTARNRAYNEAAMAAYAARFKLNAAKAATDLHAEYADDPAGFEAAWKGRMQGSVQAVPEQLRGIAELTLRDIGQQHLGALTLARAGRDRTQQLDTVKELLDQTSNEYFSLAEAGGLHLDAANRRLADIRRMVDSGVTSGFWSKTHADLTFDRVVAEANGRMLIATNTQTLKTQGPLAAFQQTIEWERDPTLVPNLSPERRKALIADMQSRIRDVIGLNEKAEVVVDKATRERQEQRAGELFMLSGKTDANGQPRLTRSAIENALSSRQINLEQYKALTSKQESTDDPTTAFNLLVAIKNGTGSQADIVHARNQGLLSAGTASSYVEKLDQYQRAPGVYATHDYKSAVDRLKAAIVSTGPGSAFVKQDEQLKFSDAVRELDSRIEAGKIEPGNSSAVWPLVEDMLPRYQTTGDTEYSLPRSRFGEIKSLDDVSKAAAAAAEAVRKGEIDDTTRDIEGRLLRRYELMFLQRGQQQQLQQQTTSQADEARRRAEENARRNR
jgi:hypothetical protein